MACARRLGLPADDPVVVSDGYSVRVHLRPAPVLTRVVTRGRVLRGDPRPWMEREVAVAAYAARRTDVVVPPWHDPGPHEVDGLEVSLWSWVEVVPGTVAPQEVALSLHALHRALADCPVPLPPLAGPLADVDAALRVSDDPVLHGAAAVLLPRALTWPRRPLHGDAHAGNLLPTADGPRWTDLEDVCAGPVEWDLASRTHDERTRRAYPGHLDVTRLQECRDLRTLQVLAAVLLDDQPDDQRDDRPDEGLRGRLEADLAPVLAAAEATRRPGAGPQASLGT